MRITTVHPPGQRIRRTDLHVGLRKLSTNLRKCTLDKEDSTSNDYMHWYGWVLLITSGNNTLKEVKNMRAEHEATKK